MGGGGRKGGGRGGGGGGREGEGGGGGGVIATKKKDFLKALKKIPQKNVATKIERGGVGKALVAGPLKK